MGLIWQILLAILIVILVFLVGLKIYVEKIKVPCTCTTDLTGKTAIITGANTGIGYWTALDLSRRNARVILACRNKEKGQGAVEKIITATGNRNVVLKLVSLDSLKSVRQFAAEIIREEENVDILINNAGVAGSQETRTEDGLEHMIATNHFGPFLLTNLLLDLIKKSAPSRVINVSSVTHGWSELEFDNVNSEKRFDIAQIYFRSKLTNIMFTKELARRLEGTGVVCNSLHPGCVVTELWRELPPLLMKIFLIVSPIYFKTPEEGAQTTIHVAVSKEAGEVSGKYFVDCAIAEDQLSASAKDEGQAKKLWEISERYTGLLQTEEDKE